MGWLLIVVAVGVNAACAVWHLRRIRQYDRATRGALRISAAMVHRCAAYLDCDQCGGRVDPRDGAIDIAYDDGLRVRCHACVGRPD